MNDLQKAKILFTALLNGKSHSSPHYEIYEEAFLTTTPAFKKEEQVGEVLQSFKLDVMQGDNEACCVLAKVNAIGFYQQKDEYSAILLTLIGYKLGNRECQQFVAAAPTKYEILKHTANNFIYNYIGRYDITFDDAILLAACSDTLNTSILGDPNYNNMYNLG